MKEFFGKILLFGEYSILLKSMGLAVPFFKYSGHVVKPQEGDVLSHSQLESNKMLKKLVVYLSDGRKFHHKPDTNKLMEDVLMGMNFQSTIPQGYGIGSSGALTAAIFNEYFLPRSEFNGAALQQLTRLKHDLAIIETFFHGNSSGTDPLVSYLNQPVLLNAPGNQLNFTVPDDIEILLIDSEQNGETKGLVSAFNQKIYTEGKSSEADYLKSLTNKAIYAFLENQPVFFDVVKLLSDYQKQFLSEMVPHSPKIETITKQFPDSLSLKLCGSGGGGFLLGFAKKQKALAISETLKKELLTHHWINLQNQPLISM